MNLIAATRAEGGLVILMKDFHLTYKLNRKHSLTEHNGHDDDGDDGGPVNDDDEVSGNVQGDPAVLVGVTDIVLSSVLGPSSSSSGFSTCLVCLEMVFCQAQFQFQFSPI